MPAAVHLYRPQRTEVAVLEEATVAREPLLEEILGRLERWEAGGSRQHYLLIGPRGIGKTHLLRLAESRIRGRPELRAKWAPAVLPEDFYGVGSVADLLLEVLRLLAEDTGHELLEETYRSARYEDDDAKVCDRCLDAFRAFRRDTGRGVVVMIENFDRLIERQLKQRKKDSIEIRRLRRILIEEEWLVTLCTSPTYLNAVTEPKEPFFEFFQVKLLAELSQDEQQELFWNLAKLGGATNLLAEAGRLRSRLRALYHFTGGNPRLTVMLYELLAHQEIGAVKNELDLLLDQLTPFYQDRMKDVSEQEAKVLETMALMTEGCTPNDLARETRLPAKSVRMVLSRLEKGGYVRREERRRKQTIYVIPERFFRIWHQMNHSRAARGRVMYLLEFFASWYPRPEENDRILELLEELRAQEAGEVKEAPSLYDSEGVQPTRAKKLAEALVKQFAAPKSDDENLTASPLTAALSELTKAALDHSIENLAQVTGELFRVFLRRHRLDLARLAIDWLTDEFGEIWLWTPYRVALDYLDSSRDPSVLERQQPEMREAVQLLINYYDAHVA